MKILALKKNHLIPALMAIVFGFSISACSDDEKPQGETASTENQTTKADSSNFDHPHGPEVTDMQKHKFEHEFAAQCVDRELNNPTNNIEDAEQLTKSCECIATYLMKDLTAQEAEKFMGEHEHPQSLRIKFEAAAYECVQEKAHPAGPKLFGKPQG